MTTYTHTQASSSDTWTIFHNMNCLPAVSVHVKIDNVMQVMIPAAVEYPDRATVVVRFTSARVGEARLA